MLHIAYIAGFFDGEGCVYGMNKQPAHKWYLAIAQKDRRPLEAILEAFPGGRIYKNNKTDCYSLHYSGYRGRQIAEAMLPFLIVKHDEVKAYLYRLSHRISDEDRVC